MSWVIYSTQSLNMNLSEVLNMNMQFFFEYVSQTQKIIKKNNKAQAKLQKKTKNR